MKTLIRIPLLVLLYIVTFELAVFATDALLWRYDKVGNIPIRTSRVTQQMQFLSLNGWQPELPMRATEVPQFK